jgi:hypothetical protein
MNSIIYLLTVGMFSTIFIAMYIIFVIRFHEIIVWLKSFFLDDNIITNFKKILLLKIIDVTFIFAVMISGVGLLKLLIKNVEFFTKIFYA